MSDVDPHNSCTLAFEGKGRAACLAIGTAQINLSSKDDGTRLAYTVACMAGGKLAECGESLLLKSGDRIIQKFFADFIDHMAGQPRVAPPPPPPNLNRVGCPIPDGPGLWSCWFLPFSGAITRSTGENPDVLVICSAA